ncbi:hypothetical protein BT69DRAFT_1325996 [Atractiella rhizophila]|nr:hypothetical protein BT69DRAFT_1325996 [Atractiella rhizophila]
MSEGERQKEPSSYGATAAGQSLISVRGDEEDGSTAEGQAKEGPQLNLPDTRFPVPKITRVHRSSHKSPHTSRLVTPHILPYAAIREPDMGPRLTQQLFNFLDSPSVTDDILVSGAVDNLASKFMIHTEDMHQLEICIAEDALTCFGARALPVLKDLYKTFKGHADSPLLLRQQRNLELYPDHGISWRDKYLVTMDERIPSMSHKFQARMHEHIKGDTPTVLDFSKKSRGCRSIVDKFSCGFASTKARYGFIHDLFHTDFSEKFSIQGKTCLIFSASLTLNSECYLPSMLWILLAQSPGLQHLISPFDRQSIAIDQFKSLLSMGPPQTEQQLDDGSACCPAGHLRVDSSTKASPMELEGQAYHNVPKCGGASSFRIGAW